MKDAAIEVRDLSYQVNQTQILSNLSFCIKRGEFIGIIGPNGAGKTTLLKCLNGIVKAEGTVYIQGQDLESLSVKEVAKKVALMHQNTSLLFSFPSLDLVLMGRYPHLGRFGRESKEDVRLAKANMHYTDTAHFENKPVSILSGGERQRILFAKTLTQETEVILLDEPTASLDITHQEQIFKYAGELCGSGKTIIAAIHDLKIASRYCTKLMLMKQGEIMAFGKAEEVLTTSNLSLAYGVNALVYRNKITGLLDFHLHDSRKSNSKAHIHVIGGGGAASPVIRLLYENGHGVTAGVLSVGDSDVQCSEVFGIEKVVEEPFTDISDETYKLNIELIRRAETTILCNMPFGKQNIRNLEAAKYANRLIIIEDDPPETRDFSGGKGLELYQALKEGSLVTTSARLHEVI